MHRKKNTRRAISILCLFALCLHSAAISYAAEANHWVGSNGIIFAEVSSENKNLWGVSGYDETENKVGDITIESSYSYSGTKQIIAIMYHQSADDVRTGAFENKTLPAVKIISGSSQYIIATRSFYASNVQGDFQFQDYKDAQIGASSFANAQFNSNVTFQLNNGTLYENVFKDCTIKGDFNLLGSIDSIYEYAFSGLAVKGKFRMTNTVLTLKDYALANSSFAGFYLSDSLKTIGSHIFDGCDHLTKITLPSTDCSREVAQDAFPNKKELTIVIPASLTDLSIFHLKNYPDVLFQTETELPSDSPVLQYLKENQLKYQQGENGQIIIPGQPEPTTAPTAQPTVTPTVQPTVAPTAQPTVTPTIQPTENPTVSPTTQPTVTPTGQPAPGPTPTPPTVTPTAQPTVSPTDNPTSAPTENPTTQPTDNPTSAPTENPTAHPTENPTTPPTENPTAQPTENPTTPPTENPTAQPTENPTSAPTENPTAQPTENPTTPPTVTPTVPPVPVPTATPLNQTTSIPADTLPKKTASKTVTIKKIKYRIIGKKSVTVLGTTNKKLKKLRIPDTVTINGTLYKVIQIEKKAFKKLKKLRSAVIGNYVTKIGNEAFSSCKNLRNVKFGTRLKVLGKKVLYNDKKVAKITFKGELLKKIGANTFSGISRKVDIRAVRSMVKKYARLINRSKT